MGESAQLVYLRVAAEAGSAGGRWGTPLVAVAVVAARASEGAAIVAVGSGWGNAT